MQVAKKEKKELKKSKKCGICKKSRVRTMLCGHNFHMKCLKNNLCKTCGVVVKVSKKIIDKNISKKMTVNRVGDVIVTDHIITEFGSTTITKKISKEYVHNSKQIDDITDSLSKIYI